MRLYKHCPRCSEKMPFNRPKCEHCGLIFDRLKHASNKLGRANLLRGKKEYVVYVKEFPSDLTRWKLILLTALMGYAGVHCLYVGKFIRGLIMATLFILMIICTIIIPQYMATFYEHFLAPVMGVFVLVWLIDLVFVCTKQFKVPVSVRDIKLEVDEG